MSTALSRRGLISAGGAALAGAAATALVATPASASPSSPAGSSTHGPSLTPDPRTWLTGAPRAGLAYRTASFMDFTSENGAYPMKWGGFGRYNDGSNMHATMEITPGSRVRDIEWYAYNSGTTNFTLMARLWSAGNGDLLTVVADTVLTPGTGIRAVRLTPPVAKSGPFPPGTRLSLIARGDNSTNQQINGCRVGFDRGVGDTGLLATPVRVYDSRLSGGKLPGGASRVVTLPTSVVKPGVTGVIVTLTATAAAGSGVLRAWRTGAAMPSPSCLHYPKSATVSETVVVGVNQARRLSVNTTRSVHVLVDVVGTIG